MKIWPKSVVLIWLGVCLLGCVVTVEPETPLSPTSAPTWTPTSSPQETFVTPIVSPSPTPTPTVRPSSTPSPAPAAQIDPNDATVTYADRPAWRAFLGWPDDCEEGFALHSRQPDDYGGIDIYPADDNQYLVFVLCTLGPYWVEERVYWLDNRASPPTAQPLTVPELVQDDAPEQGLHDVDVLHGSFPIYLPDTRTLTNLHAYRGLKDCGVFYTYHLEDARFVLDETRYRDCEDPIEEDTSPLNTDEWPLIYPTTATIDHVGPFRKVIPVAPDLQGETMRLEVLPDGDLRLLTTNGFALLHDGVWQPYFLAPSQRFIGADAAGRLWFFPEEVPTTIFYWDSTLADYGGSAFVQADAGWMPVDDPTTLTGRGVLTDDQDKVWLATGQDVRVYADGRWTVFTRETLRMQPASSPDLLPDFTLTFAASRQQMWVGECDWGGPGPLGGGGARWLDTSEFAAGEFSWAGAQAYTSQGCVTTIAADAERNIWIGANNGIVLHFDPSRHYEQFALPEPVGYRRGYALTLTLDPSGDPWLLSALCGGASCDAARALYHLQDGTWIEVAGLHDYAQEVMYQGFTLPVLFDGTGTPWFYFGGMVFRITDNRLEEPPAAKLNLWDATVDAAGRIWVIANSRDDAPALWVLEADK